MSNSETYKQGYEQGRKDILEEIEQIFEYFEGEDNVARLKKRFRQVLK